MDSMTSHHITSDLTNLSIHNEYDGTDEIILGDGSGFTVSHIRSLELLITTQTTQKVLFHSL